MSFGWVYFFVTWYVAQMSSKSSPSVATKSKSGCPYKQANMILAVAILVVLIILIARVYGNERMKDERPAYIGGGLNNQVFTSGATMRRLGQVFSSTDQGQQTTVYNDEIKDSDKRKGIPVTMYSANSVPPALLNALAGK